MNPTTQSIYLDEAGATGNNLLDPEQPYFVYASLAMSEPRALSVHSELVEKFRIRASELKGSSLARTNLGRQAIIWLWKEVVRESKIMVADKAYALAGKFFEYIFEPVLARRSSMFYAIDFHRCMATFLYASFVTSDIHVQGILNGFVNLMKTHDPEDLEKVLSPLDYLDASKPLYQVLAFACCHQDRIRQEVKKLGEIGNAPRWDLELSQTSVHFLLASWGEEFEALEAYCDESKPIESNREMFNQFIGRKDKVYMQLGKRQSPSLVYNLASPINLVDSKAFPGVQLADVLASSLAYALKNVGEDFSKECITLAEEAIVNAVSPDLSQIDLSKEETSLNLMVLLELVGRSIKGENLFEGMAEYIIYVRSVVPNFISETFPLDEN